MKKKKEVNNDPTLAMPSTTKGSGPAVPQKATIQYGDVDSTLDGRDQDAQIN